MIDDIFEAPIPATFPPLFTGEAVSGSTDPFTKACTQAMIGCDAGLLVHSVTPDHIKAAIVFAPESPLEAAMVAMIACGVGFQNAMGALAPPEVGVHLGWQGEIYINGGRAGRLRVAASSSDPLTEPNWLVVGLELDLLPQSEGETGDHPNQTCLMMEGCGDISPIRLLESWARHTLVWLNDIDTDGPRALHEQWRGLAKGMGEAVEINGTKGTFMGIDEQFGLLLKTEGETKLFPLSSILETGATA
jgi:biotin-(acetyl-CoA carboxylase) ligase